MDRSRDQREGEEASVLTFRTEGFKERQDGSELDRRKSPNSE